ncbi:uncharacterized protein LOC123269920 isoform X1 [Cotesia glomerata]|uniref:uncharacterized protein LOC123269920 isoform X1 n=1 Tax=Cotesia glomerata TaxID=32391 RepID=UPI001D023D37|nr:uncharacterized protein LOC123269920 isoform X1 [Cotesia glomerata]
MDPELNPTTALKSLMLSHMCLAIECEKLEDIKLLFQNGINVNEPIITTGKFTGFTALHVACMKNKDHLVGLLVNDYKADVNAMAADGTQPIHLACFYEPSRGSLQGGIKRGVSLKIKILVKANANVDAEFGEEIFSKHVKDREWCPDFGDKMPLVAYTVIYDKPAIIHYLKKVNVDIISLTNKTLLMYAVEKECYKYIRTIVLHVHKDPKLMDKIISHRDNDDVPLTHYLFHPKKYEKFRYDFSVDSVHYLESFVSAALYWGADIYALINNDPATFLPNLSAYRHCPKLLKHSLPFYTSMSLSRVLYYATLPIEENSEHLISYNSARERLVYLLDIKKNQKDCIAIALKDLVFRGVFRLPVPEEEIKLMGEIIASDENLRMIVNDYKKFIENGLQKDFIEFGDKKITMYDFLMQIFDYKKLKFLAREENFVNALVKFVKQRIHSSNQNSDVFRFYRAYQLPILSRIRDAKKKLTLLENLKKIPSLRKAIPLPFELVLYIVEYLKNKQLNVFINAFYSS